jgi:hypothetical protein
VKRIAKEAEKLAQDNKKVAAVKFIEWGDGARDDALGV